MHQFLRRATSIVAIVGLWSAASSQAAMNTPGTFAVNKMGAATYSIPIQVPKGIAGLQPTLSLNYDSQSTADGILGLGWSLGGLSAIMPCPQTMARDGLNAAPTFSNGTDRQCQDGAPLSKMNGSYSTTPYPTEYRTELDNVINVYTSNSSNTAPFSTASSTGQALSYGSATGSATAPVLVNLYPHSPLGDGALLSLIGSQQLPSAVSIAYTFDTTNHNWYPNQITYKGINAQTVQFQYTAKPVVLPRSYYGLPMTDNVLLSAIQLQSAGTLVKQYKLAYQQDAVTQRSRLVSVTECDGSNNCLPATTITYSSTNTVSFGTTVQSGVIDAGLATGSAWVDFNGDGKADYCRVIGTTGNYQLACTLSTGTGFGNTVTSGVIDPGMTLGRAWIDVNGDGYPDFCRVLGTDGATTGQLACTLSTGGTGFGATITSAANISVGTMSLAAWVDVDGDGRADFCSLTAGNGSTACYLSTGSGFSSAASANVPLLNYVTSTSNIAWVHAMGFRSKDVCFYLSASPGPELECGRADGNLTEVMATSTSMDYGLSGSEAWVDANGDGFADFCRVTGTTGNYMLGCVLSPGSGSSSRGWGVLQGPQAIGPISITSSSTINPGQTGTQSWVDINNDKSVDFCTLTGTTDNVDSTVSCNLSTGGGFGPTITSGVLDWGSASRAWVDFNGDGTADFCRVVGTTNLVNTMLACTPTIADANHAVTSISTGLGQQISISYKALSDPTVYTRENTATYPFVDIQPPVTLFDDVRAPRYVVSSVATLDGVGGADIINYTYTGLKADLTAGRGLLGFHIVNSVNPVSGIGTSTQYMQGWPFNGLAAVVNTTTTSGGNAGVLKTVTNTWTCANFATGAGAGGCPTPLDYATGYKPPYYPYISQTVTQAWDLNGAALPGSTRTTSSWTANSGQPMPTNDTTTTTDGFSKQTNYNPEGAQVQITTTLTSP